VEPLTDRVRFDARSEVAVLVDADAAAAAETKLREAGWAPRADAAP
jgi:hypothetical protein